ncbi:PfkB family carbohydrate kinase [Falsiroseomonas sp.]|uniref:PfkB family carbohydrate kinase n=1 Tax=Falsiroseomonas sp. TaxID=2870721 RepID=UPI0027180257|nr:PfkB family carbohydrate kinase [Falsiroseomonas sp.]MDO9501737.1 PfkB family carbohydrate kinase [Falsiroseomonas sp.]MDP3415323.1 PfkB family carbohydrate kinase [Falsiroseomonas sp.]
MNEPDLRPIVVCLGSVVMDHTFLVQDIVQPPSKNRATGYSLGAGGLAANASVGVARLGGRCIFWGRVGDDLNGPPLLEALGAQGVDVSHCHVAPEARTPVSAVLVDPVGERSIYSYRGDNLGIDPHWLPLHLLDKAQAFLCDPRWPEGSARALDYARARGVPSVIDGEKSETRLLLDLVPRCDHAVFSEPGLANYAPGARPVEGLRKAIADGCRAAAVTRGEKGTLWLTAEDPEPRITPAFRVQATNTTGAGDVFHGAYALAMAERQSVAQAMRFASAAGGLRARDGATPTRAMVEELLRS